MCCILFNAQQNCNEYHYLLSIGGLYNQSSWITGGRISEVPLYYNVCLLCVQVFLSEYAGPLFTYLIFYARPSLIYGEAAKMPMAQVVQ